MSGTLSMDRPGPMGRTIYDDLHPLPMERPTSDKYFMDMAKLAATRSTCLRRRVGAVIVKDKHVLSTGYNGAPKGVPHCETTGCIRIQLNVPSGTRHELCRGVHAEQNAVTQAAYFGVSVKGASIYTTTFPCSLCAKILINAGITEIVYDEGYMDDLSKEMIGQAGLKVRRVAADDFRDLEEHAVGKMDGAYEKRRNTSIRHPFPQSRPKKQSKKPLFPYIIQTSL